MDKIVTAMPLACVPGAIPADVRPEHFARLRRLFDTLAEDRKDVDDGFAWRFPAHALDEVTEFVSLERKCCPFLRFHIEVQPGEGPVCLTMDGPAGTRPFLEAELAVTGRSTGSLTNQ